MDKNVLAAMARWPNVPDVFGWLSLSTRGQWRLHPHGDAASSDAGLGEPISSPQMRLFIDHNYAHDPQGRWYFQNGPQRVFVRLDAAPYILHTTGSRQKLRMQTHNGLDIREIGDWQLDDHGRLYAQTEHGPGLVAGRDLMEVLDLLYTPDNENLATLLERNPNPSRAIPIKTDPPVRASARATPNPSDPDSSGRVIHLNFCASAAIPKKLGFVRNPAA